jgi:hypothetical protein
MHSVNENLKAKIQACLIGDEGTDLAYLINLLSLEAYQGLTMDVKQIRKIREKTFLSKIVFCC